MRKHCEHCLWACTGTTAPSQWMRIHLMMMMFIVTISARDSKARRGNGEYVRLDEEDGEYVTYMSHIMCVWTKKIHLRHWRSGGKEQRNLEKVAAEERGRASVDALFPALVRLFVGPSKSLTLRVCNLPKLADPRWSSQCLPWCPKRPCAPVSKRRETSSGSP